MKKIKLEDVAKEAGVSPTTVSRVLNNRGSLSEKTKNKVYEAMNILGYYPNEIARSLFGKKTRTIGLLLPNLMDPFFGELATKLENELAKQNYKVLICNTHDELEKEENYLKMLLANQVDGIVVGSHNQPSQLYERANLPIVAIDRYVSETVPIVRSNNYQGGCLATNYLISKNCQTIALLSGSSEQAIQLGEQRAQAYIDTMNKNQLTPLIYHVEFDDPIQTQRERVQQFLSNYPKVDGVFATGDSLAGLLHQMTVSNDQTIQIVGFDGTEFITNYFNNFATIQQPIDLLVQKTISLLFAFMNGNFSDAGKEFLFDTKLIYKE